MPRYAPTPDLSYPLHEFSSQSVNTYTYVCPQDGRYIIYMRGGGAGGNGGTGHTWPSSYYDEPGVASLCEGTNANEMYCRALDAMHQPGSGQIPIFVIWSVGGSGGCSGEEVLVYINMFAGEELTVRGMSGNGYGNAYPVASSGGRALSTGEGLTEANGQPGQSLLLEITKRNSPGPHPVTSSCDSGLEWTDSPLNFMVYGGEPGISADQYYMSPPSAADILAKDQGVYDSPLESMLGVWPIDAVHGGPNGTSLQYYMPDSEYLEALDYRNVRYSYLSTPTRGENSHSGALGEPMMVGGEGALGVGGKGGHGGGDDWDTSWNGGAGSPGAASYAAVIGIEKSTWEKGNGSNPVFPLPTGGKRVTAFAKHGHEFGIDAGNLVASWGAISLSIIGSFLRYTAPADGWVYVVCKAIPSGASYMFHVDLEGYMSFGDTGYNSTNTPRLSIPVSAGLSVYAECIVNGALANQLSQGYFIPFFKRTFF